MRGSGQGESLFRLDASVVCAKEADVAEFSRALINGEEEFDDVQAVPATFPVRWLASSRLREYLSTFCGQRALVLMRQQFTFEQNLLIGCEYTIEIECLTRATLRPTIEIRGSVRDQLARPVLAITSVLEIIEPQQGYVDNKGRRFVSTQSSLDELSVGPIQQEWISRYAVASLDDNPLHLDRQFVRSHGLPNTIVHGTLLAGRLSHALAYWYPSSKVMRTSISFMLPVFEGSTVRIVGRNIVMPNHLSAFDRLIRLQLQLSDGRLAAVGEAKLLVSEKC